MNLYAAKVTENSFLFYSELFRRRIMRRHLRKLLGLEISAENEVALQQPYWMASDLFVNEHPWTRGFFSETIRQIMAKQLHT